MGVWRKKLGSVTVPHLKQTAEKSTLPIMKPDQITVVMRQHMGQVCKPIVKPGDRVLVGQKIADSDAPFSAPIHAGVSGKVLRLDELTMPNGERCQTVVIESDGEMESDPSLQPITVHNRTEFLQAVRESGLVGLGGAGFPTHIKFDPKNLQQVHTLLVNAAECEPYITSDYRTIMEEVEDVLNGVRETMKYLELKRCMIGVEENKPRAIEHLQKSIGSDPSITVVKLPSRYPQGAEKVLIYALTGLVVPEGKLPADVGVIVSNVTTLAVLSNYLRTGMPLTTKRVTVEGDAVEKPANLVVPIGTPIRDVLDVCGRKAQPRRLLMGGPMMGTALYTEDFPILKNNNAILAFSQAAEDPQTACIRCGRCVRACPMHLMPLRIEDCYEREDIEGLRRYKVQLCMECGCCSYVCPAKRHLVQVHRLAKAALRKSK